MVKQRLRLAAVAPALLDIYAADGMTLEQLMAFTVSTDHARQAQAWDAVQHGYNREAYLIRRLLTEGAVRAADRRARFVGIDVYEAAGGVVSRDLFAHDDGGWLDDAALLGRLAAEKLARKAEAVGIEGWKWVEAALDFPYGHTIGLRRIHGAQPEVSDAAQAAHEAMTDELECLHAAHEGEGDLPEEVDARLTELEAAIEAFNNAPVAYDPADLARAGSFVSVDANGELRVERGFVRPEDEPPIAIQPVEGEPTPAAELAEPAGSTRAAITVGGQPLPDPDSGEEDNMPRPLSERLVTELTAHRTLALRDAVAVDPDTAYLAVLHALCLPAFYRFGQDTCLELSAKSASFGAQAPGLAESASAKAIDARHEFWAKRLPRESDALWAGAGRARARRAPGAVRARRLAHRQRHPRAVQPPAAGDRARRSAGPDDRPRHGAGGLAADGRQLSRPGAEGPHPGRRAPGQGRDGGAAYRPPEEAGDGQGGRTAAGRHQLGARAAGSRGHGGRGVRHFRRCRGAA